ncbi:efflux RND transporter periplasmic adaptor subunit [Methylocapsa palsarum]|uniref:RND family efflux transporter, MFP subunit n=1 Tax=Methylocapsa palsarum TaxID=1612308 RepID=A0A1I4AXY7_9HYPH|nr:efflux RND transporter periplasmic adaptor subunit [Methylocapsa palsarum]SFK61472.1 RND family efflux transporter, MFP subunit [Methylocapsa palsarum]
MSDLSVRPVQPYKAFLMLCVVAGGAVGVAMFGISDRARSKEEIEVWTNQQAIPAVRLVSPRPGASVGDLVLPGNVSAFYTGSLYARASGYVTDWRKDIGARVKKGEALASIAAPELDQQLIEAKAKLVQLKAAVQQAKANADLGQATNQRTLHLVGKGWASQQQGDTDRLTLASRLAEVDVARANAEAQQAAVGRLEELTRFEQIKAPFDGVITARSVDIGDLVNADGTSGKALFQVSDLHEMRVYVKVPQAFLGEMREGLQATLWLPGQQGTFPATLVTTSNAISENSRTALVELQAQNPDGTLWPGAFAEVHFHIPSDSNVLRAPVTALIFGRHGMSVATMNDDDKVTIKQVGLGRNLGDDVEVLSGLSASDRLIDSPPETLVSGDNVRIVERKPNAPAPGATEEASRAETGM